jgi:hypothetical protein
MSRGPGLLGICQADTASVFQALNSFQTQLLMAKEAGDEGWFGTFAEMAFTVSRTNPYLTTPREVARLEMSTVCNRPVRVQNQFYEYLDFGNGRLPKLRATTSWPGGQVYSRNNVPTFVDPPTAPFFIQVFPTDPADVQSAARVLLQGLDNNGNIIYSQDSGFQVTGQYVVLDSPFVSAPMQFNSITGIQKDPTVGPIQIFAVDVTTGVSTLLLTMQPGEQTASYRRYYFHALPRDCCQGTDPNATVTLTAIAKLEMIPVMVDQDYLILQGDGGLEALIEQAQANRYASMDSPAAKAMRAEHHKNAIGLLNGQIRHVYGTDRPAVSFKPFGSASFNCITRGFQ